MRAVSGHRRNPGADRTNPGRGPRARLHAPAVDAARAALTEGIAKAQARGDWHAASEMEGFIGNILVMLAGIAWSFFAVAQRRTTFGKNLYERLTPIFSVAAAVTAPAMLRSGAWTVKPIVWPIVMFIVLTTLGTSLVYWIYARAQEFVN